MVEQRGNLDYGRDDETLTETTVEGDGFTMTETDLERPVVERSSDDVEYEADDEERNEEAGTLGAP